MPNVLSDKERLVMAEIYKEVKIPPNSKPIVALKSQTKNYGNPYPNFRGLIT